jgi:hypothetical protein
MTRTLLSVVVGLGILVTASLWGSAQSGGSTLEGAWTLQSISFAKPVPNPRKKPVGVLIVHGNHYSLMITDAARPDLQNADVASATADQLRAVWGPVTANSGTIAVKDNTLTIRPTVALNTGPMAPKAFSEFTFALEGDTLTLTSVRGFSGGPIPNPQTTTWTRAR